MAGSTFVVVGASLAGAKAAEALRQRGFEGGIVLVGAEPHRPYERPPLSKGYLLAKSVPEGSPEPVEGRVDGRDSVFVHSPGWYAEHDVELRTGTRAVAIDRDARQVRLSTGVALDYDRLLLATGSRPRTLDVPGADAPGVATLRTLDDADRLGELLAQIDRLVIVGAGWIGLEVAAAARSRDVAVTVVETAALPLLRVLGPQLARSFADLHASHGVDFHFDSQVDRILVSGGSAAGVALADGSEVHADAVVVGVGATPRVELARDAGLEVSEGVLVDASLRTSDPAIFAAGDIAEAWHPFYERRIRVEHWANALNQPAVAAAAMLGEEATYQRLPYFFTDQYDVGMEFVGAIDAGFDDVVVRGDLPGREYVAFWLAGGRVVAGMNVNVWDVVDQIRALIESRTDVDPRALANPDVPVESLHR